jgi:hypothetical protein
MAPKIKTTRLRTASLRLRRAIAQMRRQARRVKTALTTGATTTARAMPPAAVSSLSPKL